MPPRPPYVIGMATNAILAQDTAMKRNPKPIAPTAAPVNAGRWQAVLDRDASQDGAFVFAVSSTGIFCRPSCPAKRPRRENVSFFRDALAAEQAGFRAGVKAGFIATPTL